MAIIGHVKQLARGRWQTKYGLGSAKEIRIVVDTEQQRLTSTSLWSLRIPCDVIVHVATGLRARGPINQELKARLESEEGYAKCLALVAGMVDEFAI